MCKEKKIESLKINNNNRLNLRKTHTHKNKKYTVLTKINHSKDKLKYAY